MVDLKVTIMPRVWIKFFSGRQFNGKLADAFTWRNGYNSMGTGWFHEEKYVREIPAIFGIRWDSANSAVKMPSATMAEKEDAK